ncbi:hypothetical protein D9M69_492870 [compost metagenome]
MLLVLGFHFTVDFFDAELFRDRTCRSQAVAGGHDDLHIFRLQPGYRFLGGGFDRIGHRQQTGEHAVDGQVHDAHSLQAQQLSPVSQQTDVEASLFHQGRVAELQPFSVHLATYTDP